MDEQGLDGVYDAKVIVGNDGDYARVDCDGLIVSVYLHSLGEIEPYYVIEVDDDPERTAPFKVVVNDKDVFHSWTGPR